MGNSEKNALGRVLLVLKEVYLDISEGGELANPIALLDKMSAVLTHINDEKQPISKLLPKLKREVRAGSKSFYRRVELYFKKVYPVLDYDFQKAVKHIPAIIHGNDRICEKMIRGEINKAKSMCDAMKSYPGFLFGEFEALTDKQFYDLVFSYYPKIYEKEDFMENMKQLFE